MLTWAIVTAVEVRARVLGLVPRRWRRLAFKRGEHRRHAAFPQSLSFADRRAVPPKPISNRRASLPGSSDWHRFSIGTASIPEKPVADDGQGRASALAVASKRGNRNRLGAPACRFSIRGRNPFAALGQSAAERPGKISPGEFAANLPAIPPKATSSRRPVVAFTTELNPGPNFINPICQIILCVTNFFGAAE